jgi:hypothetical protein
MPRAQKGQRFGGRTKGTPNKATLERLERERIAEQVALQTAVAAQCAPGAEREIVQAGAERRKLGKERLEELLEIAIGATAFFQPTLKNGVEQNPNADWTQFQKWFQIAHAVAATVSPFQSPTFRAIMVAAQPTRHDEDRKSGDVIPLNDPVAAARIYHRIMSASLTRSG